MKKACSYIIVFFLLVSAMAFPAAASEPYTNYIYDHSGVKREEPQAYIPDMVITGVSLGIGNFKKPSDCFIDNDDRVYIADSGNNRILVLRADFTLEKEIKGYEKDGTHIPFNNPTGLYVTDDKDLYIADSGSGNILILDGNERLKSVIPRPKNELLDKSSNYIPTKVAVDQYDRIYIVASGVNQGMVELNPDGSFLSFFGAVTVDKTFAQVLKRAISISALQNLLTFISSHESIPTEYSNLTIDGMGFVMGTVAMINSESTFRSDLYIHRLNPKGNDILVRPATNPPVGDRLYYDAEKRTWITSKFCDITTREAGIYSALDGTSGRVFTYNHDGALLYVFGGQGDAKGLFGQPAAVDVTRNGRYLVLDQEYGQITVFSPTVYGSLITDAQTAYYNRNFTKAQECYNAAMKYTSSSELVYSGVADSYYRQGDYAQAMQYYKLSKNQAGYSEAMKSYRGELFSDHFAMIAVFFLLLAIMVYGLKIWRGIRRARSHANVK